MSNGFLTQPRPARVRVLVATAVLAVVFAGLLVVRSGGGPQAAASEFAAPVPSVSAAMPAAAPRSTAEPIRLVEGARRVHGVAVGYPRTDAGAVSAAVEYLTQLDSNLDFDRAVQVGAVVADPDAPGRTAAAYIGGVADSRRFLGLPESGPVPTGASVSVDPVSYQLRERSGNRITVLMLTYITAITPAQGMRNMYAVVPRRLAWTHGDWKFTDREPGASDYVELRLRPGSTEAVAAGWLPING